MDSSLKKSAALLKRLRSITPDTFQAIINELAKVRLSKYIEEIVTALLDNKIRTSAEIFAWLEICTHLNGLYDEFQDALSRSLIDKVNTFLQNQDTELEGKVKLWWRITFELHLAGLFTNITFIFDIMNNFVELEKLSPQRLLILSFWIKVFKVEFDMENRQSPVSADWKIKFNELFISKFKNGCRILVKSHNHLRGIEKKSKFYYENRGDLSETQESSWKNAKEQFDEFQSSLQTLSDHLGMNLPELETFTDSPTVQEGRVIFADLSLKNSEMLLLAYETEEERDFYEGLINVSEYVPPSILPVKIEEEDNDDEIHDVPNIDPDADTPVIGTNSDYKNLDELFASLESIHNSSMADKAAIEFCLLKSKHSCKSASTRLIELVKRRPDLTPFIGRILANVKPYYPDVGREVASSLLGQYLFLLHKKDPIRVTRARICRALGELTKFRIVSQGKIFSCLRKAVEDFVLFNVDMVCMILENCGRFLAYQPESGARIQNLKEIVIRKKSSGLLDQNRVLMIENALFLITPQDFESFTVSESLTKDELYISYLIYSCLKQETAEFVFTELRKLPLLNPTIKDSLIKIMLKFWKLRESSIPAFASLIGGISKFYPDIVTEYLDLLCEYFFISLDLNHDSWCQRRLSFMKLIGELFNYCVLDVTFILEMLSILLSYGHLFGIARVAYPSILDSPNDVFRIRLICCLLNTMGEYLRDPQHSSFLAKFIVSFEYYICTKKSLSYEINILVEETYVHINRTRKKYNLLLAMREMVDLGLADSTLLADDMTFKTDSDGEIETVMDNSKELLLAKDQNDFDTTLMAILNESQESRKLIKKPQNFEIAVPLNSKEHAGTIKLMSRKKNRPLLKDLSFAKLT